MNRRRTVLLACAALAATTIIATLIQRAAGANAAMAVALAYGAGAIVMAWITSRATEYPRWAWFGSAGVFALALVVAALALPAPTQVKEWSTMAWMFPWLHLTTALSASPAKGACAARGTWGGPLILGTSVVFSSILLVAAWLTR
jgi:hypothetical protein